KRGQVYLVRLTVTNPKPRFNFLIEDPLPAAAEVVNTGFAVESAAASRFLQKKRSGASGAGYWWQGGSAKYEYRDDRVVITADYLAPGVHEYFYYMRPTVRGTAGRPAARAFPMYEPEVFGRSGADIVRIR